MAWERTAQALHDIAARARVSAHAVTSEVDQQARMRATTNFMEAGEREHAHLARALVDMLGNTDDMPPAIGALLERAAGPSAQFDWLLELAILVIGIFGAAGELVAPEMQDMLNKAWERNLDVPVSVQELALAELRGFLEHEHALALARETGFSPDKYDIIYNDTGEPPAIQELLFLFRRGYIDRGRLEHGIKQSRVRDEWIDAIEALQFAPPSAQEAIAAAVQGHLAPADAQAVVAQNGIDPEAFGWLLETAGRPPGPAEMVHLMNRGVVTRDQVVAAILESDIKDKYVDAVIQLGVYVPPVRSIVAMLRASAINDDQARALFTENGVRPEDAAGYIAEAHKSRSVATRQVTEGSVVTAYKDQMIARPDAQSRLQGLGYDAAEATFLLDLADTEAALTLRKQTITTTRSKYVAHHIDQSTASAALDHAGVPADQRDHLLALWTEQRAENTRQLTPAVLVKGVKGGALSFTDFLAYMSQLGYSDKDAQLYAAIESIGPTPAA